jgi:hypothetical protein
MTTVWLPIETAPQEGSFLVYMPEARKGKRVQVCTVRNTINVIGGTFDFDQPPRTLWAPIPALPHGLEI